MKWIEINDGRLFTISPLCSSISPFIELCTKAVEDLYKFSISTKCKINFTDFETLEIENNSKSLLGILKPKKIAKKLNQNNANYDGITAYSLWCKDIQ